MRLTLRSILLAGSLVPMAHAAYAQQPTSRRPVAARPAPPTTAERFERAWYAWDAGAFDSALLEMQRVLNAPDGAEYHDRIAELTGEIFQTVEVAKDARAPQWSSDGRFLVFETGPPTARRLKVVRAEPGFRTVIDAEGSEPIFAPDGRSIAWLRTPEGGRPTIVWAPLEGGATREIAVDAAGATQLTLFGRPTLRVALITGTPLAVEARLLVRDLTGADGTWRSAAVDGGQPVELVRSADGARVVVLIGERGAMARIRPGGVPVTGGGGAAANRPTAFAELTDASLGPVVTGTTPVFSRDGRTLAWFEATGGTTRIRAQRSGDTVVTAATSERSVESLAVSPNGATVAFTQMLREDWEVFTAPTNGSAAPTRLTREIQHDVLPQFLTEALLLAPMGEPRHRRSYLYDLTSGSRARLFHNNSVRRLAPEQEWVVSPDGTKLAIVAERDGDTVTPHRHLYLTDLSTKVSHATLVARVDSNLVAERALRAAGTRMFALIAPAVRAAVEQVSVARIYESQSALFGFDSKHISQPGNWWATEWLLARYQSYGLDAHLQRFTTALQGRDIAVANVVAVVPGTVNPELVYVVSAHFDSHAQGPGADDNTSGTAMILEAARVIAKNPLPATVMFVAFTGEESGLRGAREFARRMRDSIRVVGGLNNDMMGWANDHRIDNAIRWSSAGLRDLQHASAINFSRLVTYDAHYYRSTDALALVDAWGDVFAGIGSYPILGNPHYHQSHDVLETINHQQLAETSKATIASIMLMASSPSRTTGLIAQAKTATWDAAPERGVVRYIVRYGPAGDPMRHSMTVNVPRAVMNNAESGWRISVKAVNAAGLEGWDWAQGVIR